MSSISGEITHNQNKGNDLVTKHHLDIVGRESDSDNGIVDNNITVNAVNQSDHSSSVGGTNVEHDQSDESDESDAELVLNDASKKRLLYRNMIVYFGREFFVFLILLLTTYATYHNM